jgi:hypothetical protein
MHTSFDPDYDAAQPLNNYYFSERKIEEMKALQSNSLDLEFPQEQFEALVSKLEGRTELAAPELVPLVRKMKGQTYKDLFQSGLEIMEEVYQTSDEDWCGYNDNWVMEFSPMFAKAFPTSRFIVIVRDPRGAMASAMDKDVREKHPEAVPLMYSFAHHWRKHVAFSRQLSGLHEDRVFVLRYEDMVLNPETVISNLCQFLEVEYTPEMLDTSKFRPIRGEKWTANSRYKVPENGIYTGSVNIWQKKLDAGTIEFIEFICEPEMRMLGYELEAYRGGFPSSEILRFLENDASLCRGWKNQHSTWDVELGHELFRKHALTLDRDLLSTGMIEENFLFETVYRDLKSHQP